MKNLSNVPMDPLNSPGCLSMRREHLFGMPSGSSFIAKISVDFTIPDGHQGLPMMMGQWKVNTIFRQINMPGEEAGNES